jgi:26S proteasome regulatory subunit N10
MDNSEHMRNGDYVPSRLEAEQDAVSTLVRVKLEDNQETRVAVLAMAGRGYVDRLAG